MAKQSVPEDKQFNIKEADYLVREEISKLKGEIDLLFFGVLDEMDPKESSDFFANLKKNADNLYYLLNSNIIEKVKKEFAKLYEEINTTQRDMIYRLTELAEARSKETGNHVRRVAEFCRLLAMYYGLSQREVEIIALASPMHDVGKIALPDHILNKPGKLLAKEWEIMTTHTQAGHEIFSSYKRDIYQAAADIALQHHEKWNGEGYPAGLKGEEITISARITTVADVFDALASERSYKPAWPKEKILDYFKQEKGKHFDPLLVDILLAHSDAFAEIKERYADPHLR